MSKHLSKVVEILKTPFKGLYKLPSAANSSKYKVLVKSTDDENEGKIYLVDQADVVTTGGGSTVEVSYIDYTDPVLPSNPSEGDIVFATGGGVNAGKPVAIIVYDGADWFFVDVNPVWTDVVEVNASRDITADDVNKLLSIRSNNVILSMPNDILWTIPGRLWIGTGNVTGTGYKTEFNREITYPLEEKTVSGTNDSWGQIITFACIPEAENGASAIVPIATSDGNIVDPITGALKTTIRFLFDQATSALPNYADNTAADADTDLKSGYKYTLTGDRTVYQKP